MPDTVQEVNVDKLIGERDFWRNKAEQFMAVSRSAAVFERSFVIRQGSMQQRKQYHELARFMKRDEIARREDLGRRYLAEKTLAEETAEFEIPREIAHASINLSHDPLIKAAVAEGRQTYQDAIASGQEFLSKDSLQFLGSAGKPFGADSAIFKLATSPLLLAPVIRYFGMFPIMTGFGVTLAKNSEFHRKSSQRLHFDPEDRAQLKVFLYITDVDANSGPFMAAAAKDCEFLFERPDFVLDRQEDTVLPDGALHEYHGPAGTIIFTDTCRCLHGGGRPGERERLMLSMEYNMPTYLGAKLWEGDPEPERCRTENIRVDNRDEFMNALLAHPVAG
jgi:hypothetical protein